jgi:hypothetical protein
MKRIAVLVASALVATSAIAEDSREVFLKSPALKSFSDCGSTAVAKYVVENRSFDYKKVSTAVIKDCLAEHKGLLNAFGEQVTGELEGAAIELAEEKWNNNKDKILRDIDAAK